VGNGASALRALSDFAVQDPSQGEANNHVRGRVACPQQPYRCNIITVEKRRRRLADMAIQPQRRLRSWRRRSASALEARNPKARVATSPSPGIIAGSKTAALEGGHRRRWWASFFTEPLLSQIRFTPSSSTTMGPWSHRWPWSWRWSISRMWWRCPHHSHHSFDLSGHEAQVVLVAGVWWQCGGWMCWPNYYLDFYSRPIFNFNLYLWVLIWFFIGTRFLGSQV
jgi:hypothetical protein